jgi:branched-chain amino acid transport system ATP-binding protein
LGLIGIGSETRFYYLTLVALLLALIAVQGVRRSRTGRVLIATRENSAAAAAYGVNTMRVTLSGFALSGFMAAAAGALFVHHQQSLGSSPYVPAESLAAFTMVVVGGLGSVPGVLLGATYIRGIDYFLPSQYRILASGAGLLGVLLILPNGLGSVLSWVRDGWLGWLSRRHGLGSEASPAEAGSVAGVEPLPAPGGDVMLSLRNVRAGYAGTPILFGVDLDVRAGEVVALLGTNGAGKSTMLRVVSGLLRPRSGTIRLAGEDVTGLAPHRLSGRGVAQLPGGRAVFPSLTVAENLALARRQARRQGLAADGWDPTALFPVLGERSADRAGDLSGGQQQMLALAMVLAVRPQLLLLDELSLGLAPAVVAQLLPLVTALRDAGTAVIIVEQSVAVALEVADTAYVMEKGQVRFRGPAAELADHPELLHPVFLSGATGQLTPSTPAPVTIARPAPGPVLVVEGVSCRFGGVQALDGVGLALAEGEILGLIGANGAGKTTLFDVIAGGTPADAGRVTLSGIDVTHLPPHRRAALGLGRSFQDSRLFPALTVAETVAVALELQIAVPDAVAGALHLPAVKASESWVTDRVSEILDLLHLDGFADRFVDELSTGTRRIVDLACLVAQGPRVILFDEPSAGIAQREAEALAPLLRRLRDEAGASLVVIEHDLTLLARVAERVVALDLGRVIAEGSPDEVLHHPDVLAAYLGTRVQ